MHGEHDEEPGVPAQGGSESPVRRAGVAIRTRRSGDRRRARPQTPRRPAKRRPAGARGAISQRHGDGEPARIIGTPASSDRPCPHLASSSPESVSSRPTALAGTCWDAVSHGVSGTRAISAFDASDYPCRVAADVPPVDISAAVSVEGEDAADWESRADPRRYSRAALFGVLAGREAWRDAGLRVGEPGAGVVIGSGGGGIDVGERQYHDFFTNGGRTVTPYAIARGHLRDGLERDVDFARPARREPCPVHRAARRPPTPSATPRRCCEPATPMRISGGTDGCVRPGMIFGFSRMRAVSTRYNDCPGAGVAAVRRPRRLRARRRRVDGGARARQRARARGATSTPPSTATPRPATPIIGCRWIPTATDPALHADGGDQGRPRPRRHRLRELPRHLDAAERRVEARCTRRAFGALAERLPGSSTKSMIGHPQGASGAAGVVTTALALDRGFLPPTINLINPDPACDLDFVPGTGRAAHPAAALCNCLGFGSKNSAIVLGALGERSGVGRRRRRGGGRWAGRSAGRAAAGAARLAGPAVRPGRFPRPKLCGDTLNPGALAVLARHSTWRRWPRWATRFAACA